METERVGSCPESGIANFSGIVIGVQWVLPAQALLGGGTAHLSP